MDKVCVVKAPVFEDNCRATMYDLVVKTRRAAVSENLGMKLEELTLELEVSSKTS